MTQYLGVRVNLLSLGGFENLAIPILTKRAKGCLNGSLAYTLQTQISLFDWPLWQAIHYLPFVLDVRMNPEDGIVQLDHLDHNLIDGYRVVKDIKRLVKLVRESSSLDVYCRPVNL